MKTAKELGFKKGDFISNGVFPGIIIADAHTRTPLCEVWGFEHEAGSAYAEDLIELSWPLFEATAMRYGFDGSAFSPVAKEAIAAAKAEHGAAVPARA